MVRTPRRADPGSKEEEATSTRDDWDNHTNQMNPDNDACWESRGSDERSDDSEGGVESDDDGRQGGGS